MGGIVQNSISKLNYFHLFTAATRFLVNFNQVLARFRQMQTIVGIYCSFRILKVQASYRIPFGSSTRAPYTRSVTFFSTLTHRH